jgi:hypothetical protein
MRWYRAAHMWAFDLIELNGIDATVFRSLTRARPIRERPVLLHGAAGSSSAPSWSS